MRIVNPSFGLAPAGAEQIEVRPVDWRRDPIALFTNSKPNAQELLEGVRTRLGGVRPLDGIEFVHKDSASQPAPAAVIERISQNYRVALLALAD
ncbi:MAG: hypothetical protein ACK4QW_04455 [Alphaproteobacteria bacterium]